MILVPAILPFVVHWAKTCLGLGLYPLVVLYEAPPGAAIPLAQATSKAPANSQPRSTLGGHP